MNTDEVKIEDDEVYVKIYKQPFKWQENPRHEADE